MSSLICCFQKPSCFFKFLVRSPPMFNFADCWSYWQCHICFLASCPTASSSFQWDASGHVSSPVCSFKIHSKGFFPVTGLKWRSNNNFALFSISASLRLFLWWIDSCRMNLLGMSKPLWPHYQYMGRANVSKKLALRYIWSHCHLSPRKCAGWRQILQGWTLRGKLLLPS